jgi:hypothetical protein
VSNNRNAWVIELLTWHSHDRGGVRVPFSERGGNPLRDSSGNRIVVDTGLLHRLREVAHDLGQGAPAPRWLFLVGGPGNGKSEAVEQFLSAVDQEFACDGRLIDLLRAQFNGQKLVPWRVDLSGRALEALPEAFRRHVGRLVVVQDASASTSPRQDAADILATFLDDLLDLITSPPPLPVFICCVNRGLLARALKAAHDTEAEGAVRDLIQGLIRATALGSDALGERRPSCWPLELPDSRLAGVVACWPLDMESLLLPVDAGGTDPSPIRQVLDVAVAEDRWEQPGSCADCDDAELCPFRNNAATLRQVAAMDSLLSLLRRAELAASKRWGFRDTFGLTAELLVGEWADFGDATHPCDWVHEKSGLCKQDDPTPGRAEAAYELTTRLYPQALFPLRAVGGLPEEARSVADSRNMPITVEIDDAIGGKLDAASSQTHHSRRFLIESVGPVLDPALLSPHRDDHPLGEIEDGYSQSVELGNAAWPASAPMFAAEPILLAEVAKAEAEWDVLSRESSQVGLALRFLRTLSSVVAKRSIGARLGFHGNEDYLRDYENTLRDEDALDRLRDALQVLLGGRQFTFDLLESYGQPRAGKTPLVSFQTAGLPVRPFVAAPRSHHSRPAHDLPSIQVQGYAVPLTYELYAALRLRSDGCAASSLPASVRAALDRIRHRYAGSLSKKRELFIERQAEIIIRGHGRIVVPPGGEAPRFRANQ